MYCACTRKKRRFLFNNANFSKTLTTVSFSDKILENLTNILHKPETSIILATSGTMPDNGAMWPRYDTQGAGDYLRADT